MRSYPRASGEVLAKRHELLAVGLGQGRRLVGVEPLDRELKITPANQAAGRSPLQFAGHEAVAGGWRRLTLHPGGLIARLLEGQLRADLSSRSAAGCVLRWQPSRAPCRRVLGAGGTVRAFLGKNPVDPHRAEGDAARRWSCCGRPRSRSDGLRRSGQAACSRNGRSGRGRPATPRPGGPRRGSSFACRWRCRRSAVGSSRTPPKAGSPRGGRRARPPTPTGACGGLAARACGRPRSWSGCRRPYA